MVKPSNSAGRRRRRMKTRSMTASCASQTEKPESETTPAASSRVRNLRREVNVRAKPQITALGRARAQGAARHSEARVASDILQRLSGVLDKCSSGNETRP